MQVTQYLCPHCQNPMTIKLGGEGMDNFNSFYQLVQYRHAFCETCKEKILIKHFPIARCHLPSEVQSREVFFENIPKIS